MLDNYDQTCSGYTPRIIAGSGRSGTTWIQDVLAEVNQLRTVFEPLHPQAIPAALPFASKYLDPMEDAVDLKNLLDPVFSGEFRSIWSDYRIRPRLLKPTMGRFSSPGNTYALFTEWKAAAQRYFKYRKNINNTSSIVKMIRANLMLAWLIENYNAKIVYVVRHPGAVVESKIRIGGVTWDPEPVLNHYRKPGVLGSYGVRFSDLLAQDLSPAEAHTLLWCIENQLPMEQAKNNNYLLVYYENLANDGEQEWKRIINFLNLEKSPYGSSFINQPSQQAAPVRSKQKRGGGKSWRDRIGSVELEAIENILRVTGVTEYSVYNSLPLSNDIVEDKNG